MDPDQKKSLLGVALFWTVLVLCCGLPLAVAAGITAALAGYFIGGVLMAIFGGVAVLFFALAITRRRARQGHSRNVERVDPEILKAIEVGRKSEGR